MQIGFVGLGKMGGNMVRRILRDSDHEAGLREFEIGPQGPTVGEKLEGLTGVLGWSALREGPIAPEPE